MAIAPWLTANNPLDFMRQGAALGLQIRAQDEAAERANAALALEQDKLNLTHQHYRAQAEESAARAAEALRQNNALELYRRESLNESKRQHDAMMKHQAATEALEREKFEFAKTTPVKTPALNIQLSGVNSRIKQAEGKLSAAATESERQAIISDLQNLYTERTAVQNEINDAGGKVAITPSPTFETKQEVIVPRDRRGIVERLLPNFLGGAPKPGPVTNIVTRMTPPAAASLSNTNTPPASSQTNAVNQVKQVGGMVRMKSPDGRIGQVPSEEYEQALKEGYIIWNN